MYRIFGTLILFLLLSLGGRVARGDVGVVLNESLDTSVARITGAGHSAVYLSRICPESPIQMRLCRPGEQGSIVSNYTTLGEDQPYEWNIIPLSVYLYGVENPSDRPLFASREVKNTLEQRYRQTVLAGYCGARCATGKGGEWREMVGASISRSIYIFVVSTTVRQDLDLIEKFNALPNKNHFNAFTRNCANFTRSIVNTYFPGATRGDYINDFGITSPKAIARSFSRYAHQHPEARYRVLHFGQIPGTIKRSTVTRDGTEQLFHSKKLLIPMILFASHELPFVAASYVFTGRFNPESEYEEHPTVRATEIDAQMKIEKSGGDPEALALLRSEGEEEKAEYAETPREWAEYRKQFDSIFQEAVREELIPEDESTERIFKAFGESCEPYFDEKGLWLRMDVREKALKVGMTPANLLASWFGPAPGVRIDPGSCGERPEKPATQPRKHAGVPGELAPFVAGARPVRDIRFSATLIAKYQIRGAP